MLMTIIYGWISLCQGMGSCFSDESLTCGYALGFIVYPICVVFHGACGVVT